VPCAERWFARADLEAFLAGDMLVDAQVDAGNALSCDSLVAAETSVLLLIPREEFLAVARAIPEVALALVREFERRLRGIKALAWGLATTDVESRLYRLLLNLARDQGEVSAEGTVIARFPTQRELAGRVGACRETFPESWLTWPDRAFLLCRDGV